MAVAKPPYQGISPTDALPTLIPCAGFYDVFLRAVLALAIPIITQILLLKSRKMYYLQFVYKH